MTPAVSGSQEVPAFFIGLEECGDGRIPSDRSQWGDRGADI